MQIYWLIIVKQVQRKWGNIGTVHQGHIHTLTAAFEEEEEDLQV